MVYTPLQLLKRLQKLKRSQGLQNLLDSVSRARLSNEEKARLLAKIASEALAGNLTAQEANRLTKAIASNL